MRLLNETDEETEWKRKTQGDRRIDSHGNRQREWRKCLEEKCTN